MTTKRERLGLVALLAATAALYLTNITVNGMANSFYSGAAWAGTRSWKALLFGSVDPGNFITVDKPPVSQWVMSLSGRVFGFSSASLLVPEAVMGVLAVWLTFATVRRVSTPVAAFVAATALAVTPAAALMFRFDNPDAVMVLLMVAATYCTVRAAQRDSTLWLVLGGSALGFAFLAKMLEGVMCLPALMVIYLVAASKPWVRKAIDLGLAAVAFVVCAGWYVVLTMVWPAATRPYLAGSSDNSFLNLAFGYNGFSRVQGRGHEGVDGAGHLKHAMSAAGGSWPGMGRGSGRESFAGGAMGGKAGLTRLFSGEFGLEISWLIPAALVALVGVIVLRRGRGRTDLVRATAVGAGLWLVLDGLVLSFMSGTTHAYYTLAIAAPIAILVGLGVGEGWAARERLAGRLVVALIVAASVLWATTLWLSQVSGWLPAVPVVVTVVGLIAAVGLVVLKGRGPLGLASLLLATLTVVASPAAFAIDADTSAHTGSSPSVAPVAQLHTVSASTHTASLAHPAGKGSREPMKVSPALVALLRSSHAHWSAATSTTSQAAQLELASRTSVMGIGGFTGSDPVPTLAQFEHLVGEHEVGYLVVTSEQAGGKSRFGSTQAGAGFQQPGGSRRLSGASRGGPSSAITAWVKAHYAATTVGSATVYDLSRAK